MRKITIAALSALILTVGCGQAEQGGEMAMEVAEAEMVPTRADGEAAGGAQSASEDIPSADIKVSLPQIAYTYRYGFRMAADKIAPLQSAHADLCEKKGPSVCRILNLSQSGGEGDYARASLEMEIAAPQARSFGEELGELAESKGGDPIDTSITGEDLSKQIVDTEARLRARILLRDRLMEILRRRSGSVAELVEAERGVAKVNEEIDQAQSWLAEMKGRVAFSKMTVEYSSGAPSAGSFFGPIQQVISSAATILGTTIAFIIGAIIFLLPWAIIIWLSLWSRKRFGWRFRFWQHDKTGEDGNGVSEQS